MLQKIVCWGLVAFILAYACASVGIPWWIGSCLSFIGYLRSEIQKSAPSRDAASDANVVESLRQSFKKQEHLDFLIQELERQEDS
jgi:hypothetical protein